MGGGGVRGGGGGGWGVCVWVGVLLICICLVCCCCLFDFLGMCLVHLDKLVSTEFQIHRGVRQGDPLSPKLFTAVMEEVFKKAEISEGVNVDGENLSNLRFADDVALLNETSKQMEKHMNNLNSESMKVGLKIHKGKTKYMTNYADNEDILIGQQKIEKVTEFKYLGQTTHLKDTTKEEIYARSAESEQGGAVLEKTRKYSKINNSPFHLKNK